MPRPVRPTPADLCPNWPAGPAPDPVTDTVRRFADNLRIAVGDRSLRAIETVTGVDHSVTAAILNGTTWPDTLTLARLEHGLATNLWPRTRQRPRQPPPLQ